MSETKTSDIALAGYLRAKGFGLVDTENDGRIVTFIFGDDAKALMKEWEMRPTDEMRLVKNFVTEREQLFRLVKQSRNNGYPNY